MYLYFERNHLNYTHSGIPTAALMTELVDSHSRSYAKLAKKWITTAALMTELLDSHNWEKPIRERCIEKKVKKKLTSVSFMYVCVAENVELLFFFYFFFAPSP